MKVSVNQQPVELLPGMTVRHALVRADLFEEVGRGRKVFDEWGNEVGLDGELADGLQLTVK